MTFCKLASFFRTPEYTRINVNWPTKGSVMILKTSAEKGASSLAGRFTLRRRRPTEHQAILRVVDRALA